MTMDQLTPHTFHQFDTELQDIRSRVMAMGGLVEQQLRDALTSLVDYDRALAEKVVTKDQEVNEMEIAIDEACTQVLARRQPVAYDLRLILAVVKTITNLERIGDESKHVARVTLRIPESPAVASQVSRLEYLGERVKRMLRKSLDALARFDVQTALEVAAEDEKVDNDYDYILRQMLTLMMEDPRNIPSVMQLCWTARALERIGDRACNIGEFVIYFVKGKDVRHTNLKTLAEEFGHADT